MFVKLPAIRRGHRHQIAALIGRHIGQIRARQIGLLIDKGLVIRPARHIGDIQRLGPHKGREFRRAGDTLHVDLQHTVHKGHRRHIPRDLCWNGASFGLRFRVGAAIERIAVTSGQDQRGENPKPRIFHAAARSNVVVIVLARCAKNGSKSKEKAGRTRRKSDHLAVCLSAPTRYSILRLNRPQRIPAHAADP